MAMDLISGPTTTTITTATVITATTPRTPDSDTDTPPHPPPSKRPHHYHYNNNHIHVSYKECLKNHAASIGGHALDGCCEFMPGPTANPLDPTSLTCAACGCHRNFHRRDPDDPTPLHHLVPPSAVARKVHSPPSASQLLLSLAHSPTSGPSDHEAMHNPTARGVGGVVGYYNNNSNNNGGGGGQNGNFQNKKRFRTKFSQEQKEKMYEFSEKIGWKLKKGEEKLVEEFCKQVGVDRSVFKVWMHNNKHSSSSSASASATSSQRRDKSGIPTIVSNGINNNNNNNGSSNNLNNTNSNITSSNSNNLGLNNCGGVLASGLDFNFANGGAQEAKAQ